MNGERMTVVPQNVPNSAEAIITDHYLQQKGVNIDTMLNKSRG